MQSHFYADSFIGISVLSLYWSQELCDLSLLQLLHIVSCHAFHHVVFTPYASVTMLNVVIFPSTNDSFSLHHFVPTYIPNVSFHISAVNTLKIEHTGLLRSGCIFKYVYREEILFWLKFYRIYSYRGPFKKSALVFSLVLSDNKPLLQFD